MRRELSKRAGMDCVAALQSFLAVDADRGGIADLRLEPSDSGETIDVVVVPYRPVDTEWVRLPAGVRDVLDEYGVTPAVSVERCDDGPVFLVASFPGTLGQGGVGFGRRPQFRSCTGP